MKVHLLAVGRVRDAQCRALCDDYQKRLGRFVSVTVSEVKEARGKGSAEVRRLESERLLARLPAGAHCVAVDETGKGQSSVDFSRWLSGLADSGEAEICFVVGGAWGFDERILTRCRSALRLSDMTLPHELARTVLLEQLYRAWTIQRGMPYHHA